MNFAANKTFMKVDNKSVDVSYEVQEDKSIKVTAVKGVFPKGFKDIFSVKKNIIFVKPDHELYNIIMVFTHG